MLYHHSLLYPVNDALSKHNIAFKFDYSLISRIYTYSIC